MATAPTPFFPTTVVPSPHCGCGAPAYVPGSFSPAVPYPPPSFPGGDYTFPFPCFYGAPSAFPYAASYPYPPPATSYTAATGSSPASAYDLSTLPSTANSYPTTFSSFPSVSSYETFQATIPNQIGPKAQPEATSLPTPALPELPAADSFSQGHHTSSAPKDVTQFPARASRPHAAGRTSRRRRSRPHADGDHTRELCPPQSHTSSKTSMHQPQTTSPQSPMSGESSLLELPDVASLFGPPGAYGSALKKMETALSASTTQQNKQNTWSGASMSRSFSGTNSGSSASNDVPAPTPLFGFTSSSVSTATSTTSFQCSSAPSISPSASVAQQMFGEMPTQRLEYENYSSGNQNTIQSSRVHGESTNIGEQTVDDVPESYGFNNLSSHSVFLADGTERSYYVLPENFDLERAVPKPVFDVYDDDSDGCSNDYVHVFASPPKQQPHEEEQQESGQLPNSNCFSKLTLSDETPTVDTVGAISLTNEQSIYDLEKLNDGENLLFAKQDIARPLYCSSKASECKTCNEESSCHAKLLWDKFVRRTATGLADLFFLWDPGATKLPIMFMTAAGATKLPCVDIYKRTMVQILAVQFCARRVPFFESAMMCSYAFGLGWTEVNLQQLRDPSLKVLVTHESRKEWDPGDNTVSSSALNRDTVVLQTLMLTTNGIFTLPYVITVRVQFGLPTSVPQQSCYGRVIYSQENYGIQFLWDPGILRWRTISAQHILESGTIFSTERMLPWNPGYSILLLHHFLLEFSMERVLRKSAVLNLMNLKHFCAQLSLQCHSWCTILDVLLHLQY